MTRRIERGEGVREREESVVFSRRPFLFLVFVIPSLLFIQQPLAHNDLFFCASVLSLFLLYPPFFASVPPLTAQLSKHRGGGWGGGGREAEGEKREGGKKKGGES